MSRASFPKPIASRALAARSPAIGSLVATLVLALGASGTGRPVRAASPDPLDELSIEDFHREHWAWSPLERPELPEVSADRWCAAPIDRFILARLDAAGLEPSPPATRPALIRRLTFDLTGLPPTREEVSAFVADRRPNAYRRLVDRLLASPEYGQHVAQSWLDLARFAETDGFEHDKPRDQAWRYRDWVVAALNHDLPYDRFLQQQLAGDRIDDPFPGGPTATVFCLAGPDMPDINSQEERRDYLLNDVTSTVGAVFLGLQIGCAQCHDHKFDPVSQADFYRLRACFEPAVTVKRNVSVGGLEEREPPPANSRLMIRGDWRRPGPEVEPAFPRIANASGASASDGATGRRAHPRVALARWLCRDEHPLTSRVYANRIWQHHFGRGLSTSPNDFGYLGDEPEHRELLDFLATELMRGGWSRKRLDRMIVMSATYRQASRRAPASSSAAGSGAAIHAPDGTAEPIDPENRLWSHYPLRRLTGEQLRDAMLATSGRLSRRMGGPGVRPPLPEEMVSTLLKNQWNPSPTPEAHHRRSVYVFARRNLKFPLFEAFDRPDALASCAARYESTAATQSLVMQNSAFSLRTAEQLAERCRAAAGDDRREQIEWLTRQLYCRSTDREERRMLLAFLEDAAGAEDALVDLALALVSSNEFLYLD